jgi:hypothetical protein
VDTGGDECWTWVSGSDGDGYGLFSVSGKQVRAHRFSAALHFGQIPAGIHVLHKCDNPPCVRPAHLFLGTPADNAADMLSKGREFRASGELQWMSILTNDSVLAIRRRVAEGESRAALAAEFGVCVTNVSAIVRRDTWRHL